MSVVGVDRVKQMLAALLDPAEFLSPHGLRSLSARHRAHPAVLQFGGLYASVDYEPAESTTAMFGGNSNWRGPVWFPVNYLAVAALDRYYRFFGDDLQVEYPTGSGQLATLDRDRRRPARPARLPRSSPGPTGAARCSAGWRRCRPTRAGATRSCSTSTSTATTARASARRTRRAGPGLVADLIRRRHQAVPPTFEVVQRLLAAGSTSR